MIPKTLRNFNAYVDGVGYIGIVQEGTPPALALQVEEYQGGGMIAPVDISMASVEKMNFDLTFKEFNPAILGLFGHDDVPLTLRGAMGPDNEAVIIETRGLIRSTNQDGWKPGKDSAVLKIEATPTYYKQTVNGEEVIEIDAVNMIFRSGGIDHLAGMKAALGA